MSQSVQDPAQMGEEEMAEAFGPLPVSKLEVSEARLHNTIAMSI